MNCEDRDNSISESEVILPKSAESDTAKDMSVSTMPADSVASIVSSVDGSQPSSTVSAATTSSSQHAGDPMVAPSQASPDDGVKKESEVSTSQPTASSSSDVSMSKALQPRDDNVDTSTVSSTSPNSQPVASTGPDTTQPAEIPLKSNIVQSPLPKTAHALTKSPVMQGGTSRSKYVVGESDEGPTVRQHLQQQQLVQRQKLQLQQQHQFVLHKAASVGGESSAHALTNSLIQPGPGLRIVNPSHLTTVKMQIATPMTPSSYRSVRHVVQIPGASISAPPPGTDSLNNANICKQEGADDRPDSVASEGAVPRMSDSIQVKAEPSWSSPMQAAPTIVSGSDISTLVRPGPPLPISCDQFISQASFIHGEQGIIQTVADLRNGVSVASPLSGSLIIQSVPRINPNPPSSLSAVLTTNSTLAGPICTVINGGDLNLQKFVGSAKIVQQRRHIAGPPQAKDDRHYARKIAFMKRTIRSLVFKNGALCDEVARLNQRIQTVTEERRLLCKRLQHHERNRIRRLQTQLKKAEKNKDKVVKGGDLRDESDVYGELIAKATAEAERMIHEDYSAEDSERTLSPSPTPSSMSPIPTDELMLVDDSPYSDVHSKENGMDYDSIESSPRQCSSPSSSVGGMAEQHTSGSHQDISRSSSANEGFSPLDSPVPSARTLRRSARNSALHDEDQEGSPTTV